MMSRITTIRVHEETRKLLDEIKIHRRETYEEVILRIKNGEGRHLHS